MEEELKKYFCARDQKILWSWKIILERILVIKRRCLFRCDLPRGHEQNVSKGDALSSSIRNRNYGLKDCVLLLGDGQNDVEMLSWAGKGYVMANARSSRLKETCPELEEVRFNKR